ncbi:adenine phosphoribosyltransferase [Nodosilinea sp. FACHB-131]|uniref:adenine phosphoribosyltransferase n=1 Tax=Cyanophyceae TaxID=3028117 RepID=UPI00168277FD|nr:adenine phosphoribosyltransferase [Nodosilinea sp. FACHB-131]MBD1872073.1 adenine phosphoribosyltransferase [Nodosilinea sp. FACHB-131]
MDLKAHIRDIPDFPKPGILFRDITPLLGDPTALQYTIDLFAEQVAEHRPDYIVGIESRGFIFGMPLSYKLGVGFAPVRKPGKLPAAVHTASYALEYGKDTLELHQDAFPAGSRVLIIDDLIATGGTAAAAAQLVEQTDCTVAGYGFVIELVGLEGRTKLPNVPITVLLQY